MTQTLCTVRIFRAPGDQRETVEVRVLEGQELVVIRALDDLRRQMLGSTASPSAPVIDIKTVAAG